MLETRKNMQPNSKGSVRLMFQDEAGFGRINKPKRCWCSKEMRPSVPCHHIREYRYAYGAVEPTTGKHFFLVLPRCDTICMNVFLEERLQIIRPKLVKVQCFQLQEVRSADLIILIQIINGIHTFCLHQVFQVRIIAPHLKMIVERQHRDSHPMRLSQ